MHLRRARSSPNFISPLRDANKEDTMDINNMQNNSQMCNPCKCHMHSNNCHGNCEALKKQLMAVCFCLDEVILYLDAYPDSQEALCHYHNLIAEKNKLCAEYETMCGPLTPYGNISHDSWDWINSPWPWTYEANM